MGLFDFWKKRKSASQRLGISPEKMAELGVTEADIEAAFDPRNQPRDHHYAFAHRVLPPMAFERPEWMMELLRSPDADPFLRDLWGEVGSRLRPRERVDPEGLSCHASEHGDFVLALVTMPPPERMTEAHFIALAFGPLSGDAGGSSGPGPVSDLVQASFTPGSIPPYESGERGLELKYFTLEAGQDEQGGPRTVLCGWTAEPTHFNMGDGPPPHADAFQAKVLELLGA